MENTKRVRDKHSIDRYREKQTVIQEKSFDTTGSYNEPYEMKSSLRYLGTYLSKIPKNGKPGWNFVVR